MPASSATRDPAFVPATFSACRRLPRRAWLLGSLISAAALLGCADSALAVGRMVDMQIVDRDTGETLPIYQHRGRRYVAGRPGARYAVRVSNRTDARVMAVVSVDGVNIISGQTAAWQQTGYVFSPWQSADLTGWRKSDEEVAAFEFTSLPDSYAARTGRPLDVGVIGVAVFRERVPVVSAPEAPPVAMRDRAADAGAARPAQPATEAAAQTAEPGMNLDGRADAQASRGALSEAPRAAAKAERAAASPPAELRRERLGTGHGARESSYVANTAFERATTQPSEIISIQYDRYENLVAAGVIPSTRYPEPRAFPSARSKQSYVPDPPLF